MPDDTPTGDKAVYVFIEMIALGFVLYAIVEAFKDHPSWAKVGIALVLGLLFFWVDVNWTKLKVKIRLTWVRRIDNIASDYRYRYGLALLLVCDIRVQIAANSASMPLCRHPHQTQEPALFKISRWIERLGQS